jgi:hypothetical protein
VTESAKSVRHEAWQWNEGKLTSAVSGKRLKRSGMRWRHEGGQAILTFRALVQSERFERAWKLLSRTYHGAVTLPENVVPFPHQRPA